MKFDPVQAQDGKIENQTGIPENLERGGISSTAFLTRSRKLGGEDVSPSK